MNLTRKHIEWGSELGDTIVVALGDIGDTCDVNSIADKTGLNASDIYRFLLVVLGMGVVESMPNMTNTKGRMKWCLSPKGWGYYHSLMYDRQSRHPSATVISHPLVELMMEKDGDKRSPKRS